MYDNFSALAKILLLRVVLKTQENSIQFNAIKAQSKLDKSGIPLMNATT